MLDETLLRGLDDLRDVVVLTGVGCRRQLQQRDESDAGVESRPVAIAGGEVGVEIAKSAGR